VIGLDVGEVVPFRTSILGQPDGAIEAAAVRPPVSTVGLGW
jgi:hypothetical protein